MRQKERSELVILKDKVREGGRYIAESRHYICFAAGLFFLFVLIGFILSNIYFDFFSATFDPVIKKIINNTQDMQGVGLISYIFRNNLFVAFFGLFSGLALGILPLLNCFSNGMVIGYVLFRVWLASGVTEFWRLFPHGIFELPAIFISLGLGLKLGATFFRWKGREELFARVESSIYSFIFYVVPLLFIAAIIEGLLISFLR